LRLEMKDEDEPVETFQMFPPGSVHGRGVSSCRSRCVCPAEVRVINIFAPLLINSALFSSLPLSFLAVLVIKLLCHQVRLYHHGACDLLSIYI
uniref:Uncharacterized protein n=1 Tax=Malurus cyaneus samueli TaxID=2593467 RepID=A0A8C5TWW9_9PASS